jgi:hypothetical protein
MSNNTLQDLSVQQLKRALSLRERIDALENELAAILGESTSGAASSHGGRRKMSAAARAKIGAAQKLRWAKQRKGTAGSSPAAPKATKGRRKMSAAARAKISAAASARWAKAKAANRRTLAA